jgi:uncharacterized protein with HEPN domain
MTKEFLDYVEDIIKAMNDALRFVNGLDYQSFLNDSKTVYAVIRALEIVGEASKKVPFSIREKYSQIPWKEMAGMRDKVIHDYSGVDLKRVWTTVIRDVPQLKPLFEKIRKDAIENS